MANLKLISKNIRELLIDNPKTPKEKLTWIDIANAGKKEIEYLRKNYDFSLSHLQASSSKTMSQRPVVEKNDKYLFLILHFPVFEKENIAAGEIEFFIGKDYIITLHNNNIKALGDFFSRYKKDTNSFMSYEYESTGVLLYEILDRLINDCYSLLDYNSVKISEVEELIFSQEQKIAAGKILSMRRNIINIRKIMQNHKNIIKKLAHSDIGFNPEDKIKRYYNLLLENTKRLWENFDNQKDMIEVLNSTNESYMNDRISEIMKTLTIFSVIVFPLTLFAAVFGMNTTKGMPFMDNENGFWIIIAIMMTASLIMLLIFERKKWL